MTARASKPVRVLIVDEAIDFGGSIVSTANLIRGLDREHCEPIFVSSTDQKMVRDKLREAQHDTRVIIARKVFNYRRLAKITNRIKTVPGEDLQKLLIYALYLLRHIGNFPYTLKVGFWMLRLRVDLVQVNNGMGADEIDILCLLFRKPRVMFFRGYRPMSAFERRVLLPSVRRFVAVSGYIREQAIADGVDARRIIAATPPAILEPVSPAELALARHRHGITEGDPTIGIFGRIVEWKGQREFLRAATIVLRRVPRSKVLIVGDISDGDVGYLHDLQEYLDAQELTDRVEFTGYRADIDTYYNLMDVVVHSSIKPEPSGRVIFEAMSYGVPVVGSCHGGPPEFIDDGVDGYIVDPHDTQAMAGRILTLLLDSDLRDSMGKRAARKMATLYNKRVYARKVEKIYAEVLATEAPGSNGSGEVLPRSGTSDR